MSGAAALGRQIIAAHSKSFSLASRLLPRQIRDEAAIIYAWCRRVDDGIDLCPPAAQAAVLAGFESELGSIYRGDEQSDAILAAFQSIVVARKIPRDYPAELLAGMGMDLKGVHYETFEGLLRYCHRVAGTVGLMMCHVMGVRDDRALRHAAHLGIAMQLTNICRDVAEDWQRGRIYVPANLLQHDGIATVVRILLLRADEYYRSGDVGARFLSARCAFAVRAARRMYSGIGRELARRGFDPLRDRVVVPWWRKILCVLMAGMNTLARLPVRLSRPARMPQGVLTSDVVLEGRP